MAVTGKMAYFVSLFVFISVLIEVLRCHVILHSLTPPLISEQSSVDTDIAHK